MIDRTRVLDPVRDVQHHLAEGVVLASGPRSAAPQPLVLSK
jgi:hypothetical protein